MDVENPTFANTDGAAHQFAKTVLAQQFFDSLGFSEDQIKEASKAVAAGRPCGILPKEAIVFTNEDISTLESTSDHYISLCTSTDSR